MILPERILRLMNPADRPRGNAGLLSGEAQDKCLSRLERDEQRDYSQWLLSREFEGVLKFNWNRTDKKSTGRSGWPDFEVFGNGGRVLFLEFKMPEGRFSPEQIATIERLTDLGHLVAIPQSCAQAIEITRSWLAAGGGV